MDRQYARKADKGRREFAAHAFLTWTRVPNTARTLCKRNIRNPEIWDRLRPDWHFCGSCSRMIAAHTDVEAES